VSIWDLTLNAAGEAGNTANARIQSVARSMGLFGAEAGVVAKRLADLAEKTELLTGVDRNAIKLTQAKLLTFAGLKLAFAESVNFLWATLRATIAATGQYIVEWFRTAVTYFEILTTADFWKGMGNDIKKSIPKPKERIIPVVQEPQDEETPAEDRSRKFSPIATSLAKVGGGGYSTGALDAQRENNKLTGETNRILREMSGRMKPGSSSFVPAFG